MRPFNRKKAPPDPVWREVTNEHGAFKVRAGWRDFVKRHVWVKAETEHAERTVTVWEDCDGRRHCRNHVDGLAPVMERAYRIAAREARVAEAEAMKKITDRGICAPMREEGKI